MLGGYQILDLRGIDLSISQSASDITNANVLNQLLKLRDYIDKAYNFSKPLENQLKPVLIRFRDKKANEKIEGATFGELSVVDNYYSFKITARLSGVLVLTINVTFEEVENGYGNMEWIIDDATIQLANETQTISGDLTVEGDLSVDGDVDVDGGFTANEIVEKMTGYSFLPQTTTNITVNNIYVGVVKNGNKLTFVHFLSITRTGTVENNFNVAGIIKVPDAIMSKLYPYEIQDSDYALDYKKVTAYTKTSGTPVDLDYYCEKINYGEKGLHNTLVKVNSLEVDTEYVIRLEETFLLSDNLIPQE